jgi:hypothetical protein
MAQDRTMNACSLCHREDCDGSHDLPILVAADSDPEVNVWVDEPPIQPDPDPDPPDLERRPNQFNGEFDLAFKVGGDFEAFFRGLIARGAKDAHFVECKRELQHKDTGNLYVEYECRGKKSGLATTEAVWWAFGIESGRGDIECIVLVTAEWLKAYGRRWLARQGAKAGGDDHKSRAFLIPVPYLGDFQERERQRREAKRNAWAARKDLE